LGPGLDKQLDRDSSSSRRQVGNIIRANISSNNIDLNPADNVVMETRYKAYASNAGGYRIFLPVVKRQ